MQTGCIYKPFHVNGKALEVVGKAAMQRPFRKRFAHGCIKGKNLLHYGYAREKENRNSKAGGVESSFSAKNKHEICTFVNKPKSA